jgi:hypothetical protein
MVEGTVPKVTYTVTLEQSVEVEISDEQLLALRESSAGACDIQQHVVDTALGLLDKEPYEFVMGLGWIEAEDGTTEELFDV